MNIAISYIFSLRDAIYVVAYVSSCRVNISFREAMGVAGSVSKCINANQTD
jgi:hypothetical protein